jgi:hypothetical protein
LNICYYYTNNIIYFDTITDIDVILVSLQILLLKCGKYDHNANSNEITGIGENCMSCDSDVRSLVATAVAQLCLALSNDWSKLTASDLTHNSDKKQSNIQSSNFNPTLTNSKTSSK